MTYNKFEVLIAQEFRRHKYILDEKTIDLEERKIFEKIMSEQAEQKHLYSSLRFLSTLLEQYHKSKVIILIDEYDAPIHEAFIRGYYEKVTGFMRSFLGEGLKDNSSLELSVITGILRTTKEGIFSGLNNLKVFTLLNDDSADKFGFTDKEIEQMLYDFKMTNICSEFKNWYNGYLIGNIKIYNPWSSLMCVDNKGKLIPYWVNTSDNGLIKKIIATTQPEIKEACAELKEKTKLGLIIEFKKKDKKETLEECANRALEQVKIKNYATELYDLGIQKIAFFGLACHKKEILLKQG